MRPVTGSSSLALHVAAHPVARRSSLALLVAMRLPGRSSRSSRSHAPTWAFLSRLHVAVRPVAGSFSLTLHVATHPSSHTLHAAVCTCAAGRSLASSRCVSQPFKRTRAFYVKKGKQCENAIKTYTKRKRPHRCTETEC